MDTDISSLRFKDLEIFREVARAKSIREVARRFNTTSGQISKSIQSFEKKLGEKLFRRSVSGMLLTTQGGYILDIVDDVLTQGDKISSLGGKKGQTPKVLAIAGTSFLNTHMTTHVACRFLKERPELRFRFLDLPPDQLVVVGLRGGFELALHLGKISWPSTWMSKNVGTVRWILCCRMGHPLASSTSIKKILEYPFVVPTYWTLEGLTRGNDQFPVPISKRKIGFETSTADATVPILMGTDQIAFLPELLVRSFIEEGKIREISPVGVEPVERDLFLTAKSDAVPASVFEGLIKHI